MSRLAQFIRSTLDPALYHGHYQQPPFFEGWYFKLVNPDASRRYAIIPGVFLGEDGHSFVQVLDGGKVTSAYHRYPLEEFWASKESFDLRVGPNRFTLAQIDLAIDDELGQVQGQVRFGELAPWPVSLLSPGIMGWYAWVPRMECYHGVISLDHGLQGSLQIDGQAVDFSGGRGYIEKDWGQAFPEAYIWLQSNHFETLGSSLSASIAVIPWLGTAFRGFIVGFWHQGKLYRFATYNGSRVEELQLSDRHVRWALRSRTHRLELDAYRAEGGLLHAPTRSEMQPRVEETMQAEVQLRLSSLQGGTVFAGTGQHTALEVHGDLPRLLAMK